MEIGLVAGVIAIGFIHGVLPDHGWPIAATYALNRPRKWVSGTIAGLILGMGHLFSSVVLVVAYFWFSRFANFAEGPWLRYVAGILLILLGINEYRSGSHVDTHTHDHAHDEDHHAHTTSEPDDDRAESGFVSRLRSRFSSGESHHHLTEEHAERGLLALGMTALFLGFAHEEPIQILAICAGTAFCLELMIIYSLAVIIAILVPTLLLIAGYERHRSTVEAYTPYLPLLTAVVLIGMGMAFVFRIF